MSGIFRCVNIRINSSSFSFSFFFLPNQEVFPSLFTYWFIFITYLMTLSTKRMKLTPFPKASPWISLQNFFRSYLTIQFSGLCSFSHKILQWYIQATSEVIIKATTCAKQYARIILFNYYIHLMR